MQLAGAATCRLSSADNIVDDGSYGVQNVETSSTTSFNSDHKTSIDMLKMHAFGLINSAQLSLQSGVLPASSACNEEWMNDLQYQTPYLNQHQADSSESLSHLTSTNHAPEDCIDVRLTKSCFPDAHADSKPTESLTYLRTRKNSSNEINDVNASNTSSPRVLTEADDNVMSNRKQSKSETKIQVDQSKRVRFSNDTLTKDWVKKHHTVRVGLVLDDENNQRYFETNMDKTKTDLYDLLTNEPRDINFLDKQQPSFKTVTTLERNVKNSYSGNHSEKHVDHKVQRDGIPTKSDVIDASMVGNAVQQTTDPMSQSEYDGLMKKRLELISNTYRKNEQIDTEEDRYIRNVEKMQVACPISIVDRCSYGVSPAATLHSNTTLTSDTSQHRMASPSLLDVQPETSRKNLMAIRDIIDRAELIGNKASADVDEEFLALPVRVSTSPIQRFTMDNLADEKSQVKSSTSVNGITDRPMSAVPRMTSDERQFDNQTSWRRQDDVIPRRVTRSLSNKDIYVSSRDEELDPIRSKYNSITNAAYRRSNTSSMHVDSDIAGVMENNSKYFDTSFGSLDSLAANRPNTIATFNSYSLVRSTRRPPSGTKMSSSSINESLSTQKLAQSVDSLLKENQNTARDKHNELHFAKRYDINAHNDDVLGSSVMTSTHSGDSGHSKYDIGKQSSLASRDPSDSTSSEYPRSTERLTTKNYESRDESWYRQPTGTTNRWSGAASDKRNNVRVTFMDQSTRLHSWSRDHDLHVPTRVDDVRADDGLNRYSSRILSSEIGVDDKRDLSRDFEMRTRHLNDARHPARVELVTSLPVSDFSTKIEPVSRPEVGLTSDDYRLRAKRLPTSSSMTNFASVADGQHVMDKNRSASLAYSLFKPSSSLALGPNQPDYSLLNYPSFSYTSKPTSVNKSNTGNKTSNDIINTRQLSERNTSAEVDFLVTRSGEIIKRPLGDVVKLAYY